MRLKITLSLLIVILLAVRYINSPFNASTAETTNNGLDLKKTAIQTFKKENTVMNQPDKKTKEESSATHTPTKPPQKQNHSISESEKNKNIMEDQEKNTENKSDISDFVQNAQEQEIQKTKDGTITPPTVKIQITIQPAQEIEIKSIKNFTPVVECLDSEKNSPCPDRRI